MFSIFGKGSIKGQNCPRGSIVKNGSKGLQLQATRHVHHRLTAEETNRGIAEMAKECKKMKTLRYLQKAFVEETGVKTWDKAEETFPSFANAEALDQFIEGNSKKTISGSR